MKTVPFFDNLQFRQERASEIFVGNNNDNNNNNNENKNNDEDRTFL